MCQNELDKKLEEASTHQNAKRSVTYDLEL